MKRSAAITTLMVTLGLLSACTPEADPTPSPTPSATSAATTPTPSETPTSASPEPSPSPSPSETLDADQQAARDVVNEFFVVLGELRKDPDKSVQALADITTGQTQTNFIESIAKYRQQDAVQIGDATWTVLEVSSASDLGSQRVVDLTACTDSSAVDIVNQETNESILAPDRPTLIMWNIRTQTENGRWKVGDISSDDVDSCGR